jgi:hypothetical protein
MNIRRLAPLALLLSLSGCASVTRIDAADDIHALLLAIRDGNQAAFDAHVDRPALRLQIEGYLVLRARDAPMDNSLKGLAMLLAGPAARAAGDLLLRPQVFRAAAEVYGYTPGQPIPGPLAIAGALKATGDGRVCATRRRNGPCLLTFARQDGFWKLTRFDGDPSELRLP